MSLYYPLNKLLNYTDVHFAFEWHICLVRLFTGPAMLLNSINKSAHSNFKIKLSANFLDLLMLNPLFGMGMKKGLCSDPTTVEQRPQKHGSVELLYYKSTFRRALAGQCLLSGRHLAPVSL